jgi:AraC family transcriptional regulator
MHTAVTIEEFSPRPRTREVAGFRFFDGRFPARMTLPSHYHDRASVFVIVEGALEERMTSSAFDCSPGTLLAKPPGERHSDQVSPRGARAIAIEYLDDVESSRMAAMTPASVVHRVMPLALGLANQIASEMRAEDSASSLSLEGLALELSSHVLRSARQETDRVVPLWLMQIRDMVRDESMTILPTLSQIAERVQRHPAYVARAFRRSFGCSIGTWARTSRLEWAARQLVTTSTPISVIAMRAGFFDQSHFSRAFRRHTRVTPLAYRELGSR